MKKEKGKKSYFFYDFVKITAAIPGLIWFRPKRIYVNENAKKKIKGGALLISNHSSNIGQALLTLLVMGILSLPLHFVGL